MIAVADHLRVVFSATFHLYFRSHVFHWNVTGPSFPQYHAFFEKVYTQAWGNLDAIAEHIRACDEMAPISLAEVLIHMPENADYAWMPDTVKGMFTQLRSLNNDVRAALIVCHTVAEEGKYFGVVNFVEGLLDESNKLNWMLKSTEQEML